MTHDPSSSLVLFACEGREHLLRKSVQSLSESLQGSFKCRILVTDGVLQPDAVADAHADIVLQRTRRAGYVRNILAALRLVETEFFFWMEDDWRFLAPVDVRALVALMTAHPAWAQVRLSKTGRLTRDEKRHPLEGDVYRSSVGFSANPCLCRTTHIREALQVLEHSPRGSTLGVDGFENVLTRVFQERTIECAVLDSPGIAHLGYLESTPRQFHMTASLDDSGAEHLLSLGDSPPLWRRVWMAAKLARRFGAVTMGQLRDDAYYDLAFRIVTVPISDKATRS